MISWFARNSVAANLLMVTIIISGLLALQKSFPHGRTGYRHGIGTVARRNAGGC